jgi:hypothetical protein
LKNIYWTQGPYDLVAISEADDEEAATAFLLALGAQGNVRTMTMRAFDRDEMTRIVQRTPSTPRPADTSACSGAGARAEPCANTKAPPPAGPSSRSGRRAISGAARGRHVPMGRRAVSGA